ncbi:hypothetical protein COL922a_012530 [Colletotrichum nupharicola]|nr:hypothetical protein COL922a_012530 [Colletotrichum nupharicola]
MKYQTTILATLATSATAFPSMMGSRQQLEELLKRNPEPVANPEPQLLGGVIGGLTGTISGLLGAVAQNINPANARFNLLANHGYLPRNGHVTLGQVIEATAGGFNMGADLSTILGVFAVLADGDIATESFYLGAGPCGVGGLNRHSTVEADISVNREDFYNGCGDNHHVSSRMFKQNVDIVASSASKQFDLTNMGTQYQKNSMFSQKYNPDLYYFLFPLIVSLGAFAFYPQFMSNETYGSGGVANYESISSIIGAKYDDKTGEFQYVPETWPKNWYRRATPYGAVQTVLEGLLDIYIRNPVVPGVAQLGTANLNATAVLCDLYQGMNSVVPLFVAGSEEQVAAATTWAIAKLDPYFSNTVLGCPLSVLSPNDPSFLYPNSKNKGGPLNTPPSVAKNVGDNVYYKTYFTTAPTSPAC